MLYYWVSVWCCLAVSLPLSLASSKNPKRGLGFSATPDDIINANQSASVISWQYNWASMPPTYLATSNVKSIPMQWGSSGIQAFSDDVRAQEADVILVRLFSSMIMTMSLTVKILDFQRTRFFG